MPPSPDVGNPRFPPSNDTEIHSFIILFPLKDIPYTFERYPTIKIYEHGRCPRREICSVRNYSFFSCYPVTVGHVPEDPGGAAPIQRKLAGGVQGRVEGVLEQGTVRPPHD